MKVSSRFGDYAVVAEPGAVSRLVAVLDEFGIDRPWSVVSNTTVGALWGERAAVDLGSPLVELADGEEHKRWPAVQRLIEHWLEEGVHRSSTVAAVGGGVVTDTVGFAAAVYLRGIQWVAMPTTLLAMVDASVGGKTGVNLDQGKNLVGAFWPPRLVVIDVGTLATLPERDLRAGAAEVLKTAWIGDQALLEAMPQPTAPIDADLWQEVATRCIAVKARIVQEDELEGGARAALNLGHTFGHALEAATGYRHFLHGEAVAWGLLAAARLGQRHGLLSGDGHSRLARAVRSLGPLPAIGSIPAEQLGPHIGRDKKKDRAGVRWVLPTDDGVALDQRVDIEEALEVFRELQEESPEF